ncbi:hypothetical protein [Spirillospora sp. NPDC029432]|uniref:hypothetical protein n=1 Tax=Spirillospora sp. NPDC029432 TaxID=3154599 RepID=UPI0034559896
MGCGDRWSARIFYASWNGYTQIVGVGIEGSTTRFVHPFAAPVMVYAPGRAPGWDAAANAVNAEIRPLLDAELQRTFIMSECLLDISNSRSEAEAARKGVRPWIDVVVGERLYVAGIHAVAAAIGLVHDAVRHPPSRW